MTMSTDTVFAAAFAAVGVRNAEEALKKIEQTAKIETKAEVRHEIDEKSAARHEARVARELAREEERKALKEAKRLTKERQIKRLASYYKTIELTVKMVSTEMGDFAQIDEAKRGTLLASMRGNARLIARQWEMPKRCLAEFVPGLAEATTIVAIPVVDEEGKRLDKEAIQQMVWEATDKYGVPHWTQSSIKPNGTHFVLYCVREDMFDKLASVYDLDADGRRYAAYGSLIFSEMDGEVSHVQVDEVEVASDGQDGNCAVPADMVPMAMQFRAMKLHRTKKVPVAIGKGIVVPMKEARLAHFNDSQIKVGKEQAGDFIMMTSHSVTTEPIKMYISAEPLMLLKDCPAVRKALVDNVRESIDEIMAEFGDKNRPALLRRLGGLKLDLNGNLQHAQRAAIEALRSNIPWCREIEEKVGRFLVQLITEKLIPSGGVQGWASLMVISDEHGAKECAREDAKYVMMRVPTTKIVYLDRDPYVKGKGYVVHSSVAKKMSGDADGDRVVLIKAKWFVELCKLYSNETILSGLKPDKAKNNSPLTKMELTDLALRLVNTSWLVGYLTVAAWKFCQIGRFDLAGQAMELANDEPMTYKHDITFNGQKFHDVAFAFIESHRKALKEINLQWRDMQDSAKTWESIREMKDCKIAKPASMFDHMWNAGVASVAVWSAKNPLHDLSLTRVARLVFAQTGRKIHGAAWREMREIVNVWGEYWGEHISEEGVVDDVSHHMIYTKIDDMIANASQEALAALFLWTPKNGKSGFSLKWRIFSAGRACEVIGFHPDVLAAIEEMRKDAPVVDAETNMFVEALVENVDMVEKIM